MRTIKIYETLIPFSHGAGYVFSLRPLSGFASVRVYRVRVPRPWKRSGNSLALAEPRKVTVLSARAALVAAREEVLGFRFAAFPLAGKALVSA